MAMSCSYSILEFGTQFGIYKATNALCVLNDVFTLTPKMEVLQ